MKVETDGSDLVYSTFLGGDGADRAEGILVDTNGKAYVVGRTESADFPLNDPISASLLGTTDAFLVQIGPDGKNLLFETRPEVSDRCRF